MPVGAMEIVGARVGVSVGEEDVSSAGVTAYKTSPLKT